MQYTQLTGLSELVQRSVSRDISNGPAPGARDLGTAPATTVVSTRKQNADQDDELYLR